MDILIIGGTSFFGKDIVQLSLKHGHKVTVFSRGNSTPDFWNQVDHITGDRKDSSQFKEKLTGKQFDIVIDNIAYTHEQVQSALDIFNGNIGHYIFTSTIAVMIGRNTFSQPTRESDTNFNLNDNPHFSASTNPTPPIMVEYAKNKLNAERLLNEQNNIPYTIIRPPNVIGPEDNSGRVQFYFQRLTDGQPLILTNGGIQSFQPGYRTDLAKSYIQTFYNPKAVNNTYTIAQNKTCRLIEWLQLAANCLNVKPEFVNIPEDIIQKFNFEYAEPWTFTGTHTFDISAAVTDLGFNPTPIESWTETTANWYKEFGIKQNSSGYSDRKKEILYANKFREITKQLV